MIPAAVERSIWLTVGLVAAVWCGLCVIVLVGLSIVELATPGSIDSSGPPSVVVITPWVVGLFLVARWSLRRSDTLLPAVGTRPTVRTGAMWRFEDWMEQHPVWRGVLIATLELCWASFVVGVLWAVVVGVVLGIAHVTLGLRRLARATTRRR